MPNGSFDSSKIGTASSVTRVITHCAARGPYALTGDDQVRFRELDDDIVRLHARQIGLYDELVPDAKRLDQRPEALIGLRARRIWPARCMPA